MALKQKTEWKISHEQERHKQGPLPGRDLYNPHLPVQIHILSNSTHHKNNTVEHGSIIKLNPTSSS